MILNILNALTISLSTVLEELSPAVASVMTGGHSISAHSGHDVVKETAKFNLSVAQNIWIWRYAGFILLYHITAMTYFIQFKICLFIFIIQIIESQIISLIKV